MSFRSLLWISAVAAGLSVPASAGNNNVPAAPPLPAPIVRTFLFPATGFSVASETVRITVVNVAPPAHNGTKASCTGNIGFAGTDGTALQNPIPFAANGTGAIATGDYTPTGVVKLLGGRGELQGSVQVAIDPKSPAPCSLLLTLEVFDSGTFVTHALVTTAIEEPAMIVPQGKGHGE
ncbi:MAG TPA: hypothetical protein VKT49_17110 [Bryobacteraceae bacterium]|nr:hypothetical protein [Bryobacteraceae bacterium]